MDIKPDEGKVEEKEGKQVARYKDKAGKLCELSAICTHQGCVVGWNNKEKTWDCPCYGSRFDKKGKVIHGPAIKDLPKINCKE
jgi:Rieske Fe-S protein